jgi:hypothetical protein
MLSGPCDPCLYPNWGSTAPAGTSVSKKKTTLLKKKRKLSSYIENFTGIGYKVKYE